MGNRVLVIGGGIGGLTASLNLAQKGFAITVFEQSDDLGEAGAGIQLSPNCARVLHHIGLADALGKVAFLPEGTQFRHWRSGRVISESSLGEEVVNNYGAPYYHIHRGDLISILAAAARAHANITICTNARVDEFRQEGDEVLVCVGEHQHVGDVLIGADGIRSMVRTQLWGRENPRFTGNIAWRALVPRDKLPEHFVRPMSTAWWGPGKHFVHYYVRGGDLINCVCVVEKVGWELESWTEAGDIDELKSDFSGWNSAIQQLIDNMATDTLFKWALFDREPMPMWGKGRVSLLGDACHPTLPFMAQGAAMSIEDGAVLSACLAKIDSVPAALARYEALRKGRTASIQIGSRRNAKLFHLSGLQAWARNRALRVAGHRTMDKLFRYNALTALD